jgi:hypothetical protein
MGVGFSKQACIFPLATLHVKPADVTTLSYGHLFEQRQQTAQTRSFQEIQPVLTR